jgi:hypothetical protein
LNKIYALNQECVCTRRAAGREGGFDAEMVLDCPLLAIGGRRADSEARSHKGPQLSEKHSLPAWYLVGVWSGYLESEISKTSKYKEALRDTWILKRCGTKMETQRPRERQTDWKRQSLSDRNKGSWGG